MAGLLAALGGCVSASVPREVTLEALENAPPTRLYPTQRHLVSNPTALRPLYRPVGRRLGLVQVRDEHDWERLAAAVPRIGPCPDLRRGMVVGLVSVTGTPLDRDWPFRWESLRMLEGAGLIEADFTGGNYLPDGAIHLETAYVEGLRAVLVVTVDGTPYCPR